MPNGIAKSSESQQDQRCPHSGYQVSCGNCRLSSICLPIALETEDIDRLDHIVQRGKPLRKGEHVFREHDPFSSFYAVRSGSVKTYRVTGDGQEQVTGFYFPGEILGMDGVRKNKHSTSARALETSAFCEIPFDRLEDLSSKIPNLQHTVFQLMSQQITFDQQLITMLSKNSAEERIAALILSVSARFARRKLSATAIRLPMSRTDIGNYLGLTVETVSRVFSRFHKTGLLEVDSKEIRIVDSDRLRELAGVVVT